MNKTNLNCNAKFIAFSMAETLITLLIVAVLAVILIPIFKSLKPDANDAMSKKALNIMNRIINELISDDYLYPSNSNYEGFSNLSSVRYNGMSHEGDTKFCTLFVSRLNLAPASKINCVKDQKTATSIEGIDWYLPISYFSDNDYEIIKVDVNGEEKPNCLYNENNCKHPDQFEYKVPRGLKTERQAVIPNLEPTLAPPARPVQPPAPNSDTKDPRPALKTYTIDCHSDGKAQIFGEGANKINGNYQLVAIPRMGYKCNWFTRQVTIKDADITDCNLTCTTDDLRPKPDGGDQPTPTPPPAGDDDDDDDDNEEQTFCIIKKVTGDTDGCIISGKNPKECDLKPGKYSFSSDTEAGYTASWAIKDVEIKDKDETLTLECKKEEEEKCYNITANVTGQCAVDGAGCKVPGTYNLTITPSDNYTYNNSTGTSNYQVVVSNADVNVNITCEPPEPSEEESDPCCEKEFGVGAKYIAKSNACIKDLGYQSSEAVDCKTQKQYCKGNWAYWNYPAIYPTTYKTCLELNMDIPSIAKFLELYNNRQSVFPESHWYTPDRQAGYFTNESTRYLPASQSASMYNGKYVWQYTIHVPYDNQVHTIAGRNPGARGLCYAPAPAICKSSSNPDSGSDSAAINVKITSPILEGVHKSFLDYAVTWSVDNPPMSKGKKYKVTATDWVTGKPYFTYYGVTTIESGSHYGRITSIPARVPSNQVKVTVSFY